MPVLLLLTHQREDTTKSRCQYSQNSKKPTFQKGICDLSCTSSTETLAGTRFGLRRRNHQNRSRTRRSFVGQTSAAHRWWSKGRPKHLKRHTVREIMTSKKSAKRVPKRIAKTKKVVGGRSRTDDVLEPKSDPFGSRACRTAALRDRFADNHRLPC